MRNVIRMAMEVEEGDGWIASLRAEPDTGHGWNRRNSVALEPLIPNQIGTFGPDRSDLSRVKCKLEDPRGSRRRWPGPLDKMAYLESGLQGIFRSSWSEGSGKK
jgi:hypothetical protein